MIFNKQMGHILSRPRASFGSGSLGTQMLPQSSRSGLRLLRGGVTGPVLVVHPCRQIEALCYVYSL